MNPLLAAWFMTLSAALTGEDKLARNHVSGTMSAMPTEERVVHLKHPTKAPSETQCGKKMYLLAPNHSAVEKEDGDKITCPECKERFIR